MPSRPLSMKLRKIFVFIACMAFVGLVVAIAVPTIVGVLNIRHGNLVNNQHQIAMAYIGFELSGDKQRTLQVEPGGTAHDAAFILARDAGINDATIWFSQDDKQLNGKTLPKTVLTGDGPSATLNPDFAALPLADEIASNIPPNAPPNTPIVWTRGLRPDGTWAPDSPWQGQGGHIAFFDGHVEWFDKLSLDSGESAVFKYGTSKPTLNIAEALPPGAVILSAEPKK